MAVRSRWHGSPLDICVHTCVMNYIVVAGTSTVIKCTLRPTHRLTPLPPLTSSI